MKVLFFIRKSRLKKNGEAPVFLRITINGQQDEIRIQRSVPIHLWNNLKGCSKGKGRVSLELNSYIEALKVRLYQIHKELLCRDALITPQNMLVKLFAKEERHLVVETMKKCIDDWRSLIGQEYQPSTISRYDNCYESLKTVVKEFYKKEDITFYELNGEFIDTFEMHLRTERKLSQNTLTKYMSCFRKVLGIARDNGWLLPPAIAILEKYKGWNEKDPDAPCLTFASMLINSIDFIFRSRKYTICNRIVKTDVANWQFMASNVLPFHINPLPTSKNLPILRQRLTRPAHPPEVGLPKYGTEVA